MISAVITVIVFSFLGVSTLIAQEWTKEQKEVWETVENMWIKWKANDLEGAFANVHENYLGWNNSDPMPTSKTKWMNSVKMNKDQISEEYYDIEPARIVVQGDAAVVHFYFSFSYLYTKGDEKHKIGYHGKWSEFFVKEGGEWMLLGDLTLSKGDK